MGKSHFTYSKFGFGNVRVVQGKYKENLKVYTEITSESKESQQINMRFLAYNIEQFAAENLEVRDGVVLQNDCERNRGLVAVSLLGHGQFRGHGR